MVETNLELNLSDRWDEAVIHYNYDETVDTGYSTEHSVVVWAGGPNYHGYRKTGALWIILA